MRKLLLCGIAALSLTAAVPAFAQDNSAGAAAGATSGATLGFIFGGPVGAIIGGFSGAVIGAGVSDASIAFAGNNPVDPVYIDADLDVGYRVDGSVTIYPIDGDPDHGYFYANNRVWIVNLSSGEIVASPGFIVSERAVAYVKANPTASVRISGSVAPGLVLDPDVDVVDVPDVRGYGYVYIDDRPALVDTRTRVVVWVE